MKNIYITWNFFSSSKQIWTVIMILISLNDIKSRRLNLWNQKQLIIKISPNKSKNNIIIIIITIISTDEILLPKTFNEFHLLKSHDTQLSKPEPNLQKPLNGRTKTRGLGLRRPIARRRQSIRRNRGVMIVGDDIRRVEVAGEVSWNGAAAFLHAANGPHEAAPTHHTPFRLRLRVVHSSTGCVRAGDAVHGRQTVFTALDERRSSFSRSETIPFDL